MLNLDAKAGDASNLASLSKKVLRDLNVRGNGRFRIYQDGASAQVKWVRGEALHPKRVNRMRMALGGSGATAGRLTGPVQFVRTLMDSWRLDTNDVVHLLGCEPRDFEYISAVLDGRRQLRGRDVRDRIAHLFIIRRTLWSLFRDLDVENDWLRDQYAMLNGKSPMSLIVGPPVFYSALSLKTANAEVAYSFRKSFVGNSRTAPRAYYQGFCCTFEGLEKDLRSKVRHWPNLVHDSDYAFCNQLGVEALKGGVDGLVVPSARHEGTNMPIFLRQAISSPQLEPIVQLTYSPDTGEVTIDYLPRE